MLRLKELREQRRLNQEGLAMELNVSQSTISAYEIGAVSYTHLDVYKRQEQGPRG